MSHSPPPFVEQTRQVSPKSSEAFESVARNASNWEPLPRSEPSQYLPTLPPVSALGLANYAANVPTSIQPLESGSPATGRGLGMRNILNPTSDIEPPKQVRRISQSPVRSVSVGYGLQQTPLISPRIRKRKDGTSPGPLGTISEQRQGRRVLTPKSPSLRSISQGARASPSGGGHTRLPLASSESRSYTAEPGMESRGGIVPPLPHMAVTSQSGFQHNYPSEAGFNAGSGNLGNSASSYPPSTYAFVDSPGSSSAAERDAPSPFRPGLGESLSRVQTSQPPMTAAEPQSRTLQRYPPISQPVYQMKLDTEQGSMILPVELDVQQASKLADEKRKRNAGASARFRQRRKEKEQAASQAIADLQRQMRELTEERDHYLNERNILRDHIVRTPGSQLPPRPPSPHSRRIVSHMAGGNIEASTDYSRRDPSEPMPAQRRRTSEYQPSYAAATAASPSPIAPGNFARQYPPPSSTSYSLPAPSMSVPLPDPRSQAPPNIVPPTHGNPASGPSARPPPHYDHFRRDTNPR